MIHRLVLPAMVFVCAGCASDGGGAPAQSTLSGSATYRERMALPPSAVFEVTLEDVSRADAPAEVIGRTRIESPGNPPIRFAIPYDPAKVSERHRYVVRARITVDGTLMFTTDTAYPVLVPGKPDAPELLLKRTSSGASATVSAVENVEWHLVRLGTTPAVVNPQNPPRLTLQAADHRVAGSGGCNRMGGSYEIEGDRLEFGQMIGTMMACPQGMEQERAFHQALARVKRWRLDGAMLELLDESGQAVLALQRRD
ncbi:MAG TPA: YbaY family lipoprotein [Povalibacter sp.]|uniref:YbaY family lipoprotein n=1 Tax=Povalibacter sp. TaxID=1962978 RepID=UPI002CE2F748|nr:YbaY family lipoprotein [Povalibacter sp.]HMN47081.1 YbaY family lipoprotein [Povalibacter sp.]